MARSRSGTTTAPQDLVRGAVGGPDSGGPVRISYLGHACLLVELGSTTLLVDPGAFADRLWDETARPVAAARPDAVLVTHAHPDHVDPPAVAALVAESGATLHAEAGAAELLRQAGAGPAVLAAGDALRWDGAEPGTDARSGTDAGPGTAAGPGRLATPAVTVEAVGGEHAVIHPDVPRVGNVGLIVRAEGRTVFHPGDSYAVTPQGVTVLAVPLNAPWAAVRETVDFVRAVAPEVVVPVHDGLLRPDRREIYLGHVRRLGGAAVHDLALDGPLDLAPGDPLTAPAPPTG